MTVAASIVIAYPKASLELAQEVINVSRRVGVQPEWLANLINAESGFRASAVNKYSGASGLIQFMPDTARGHGTTVEAIRGMNAMQQMPYVEEYLQSKSRSHGGLQTQEKLFLAVFYPAAIKASTREYCDRYGVKAPCYDQYQMSSSVRSQNPGIHDAQDYINFVLRKAKMAHTSFALNYWWVGLIAASLLTGALMYRRRFR